MKESSELYMMNWASKILFVIDILSLKSYRNREIVGYQELVRVWWEKGRESRKMIVKDYKVFLVEIFNCWISNKNNFWFSYQYGLTQQYH